MKSLFDDEVRKEEKPADIQHLFVDEAGDPTLLSVLITSYGHFNVFMKHVLIFLV